MPPTIVGLMSSAAQHCAFQVWVQTRLESRINRFKPRCICALIFQAARVIVKSLKQGSVVVDFSVKPDSNGVVLPPNVLKKTFAGVVKLEALNAQTTSAIVTSDKSSPMQWAAQSVTRHTGGRWFVARFRCFKMAIHRDWSVFRSPRT